MPGFATTRLLIVFLLGLTISGCGFRLAGDTSLPPELKQIYLVTHDFSNQQRDALRRQLERAGAEVASQADTPAVLLSVSLKIAPDRRLVTSASNGRIVERITRSLNYSLKDADGKPLAAAATLTREKDIVLDDDNLLSSTVERRSVIEDIEQALYDGLIRQLKRI
jgi:outer membrane lipopolysaccharide assembly protein LptE/RlpB